VPLDGETPTVVDAVKLATFFDRTATPSCATGISRPLRSRVPTRLVAA
jgi:hypothetical protein